MWTRATLSIHRLCVSWKTLKCLLLHSNFFSLSRCWVEWCFRLKKKTAFPQDFSQINRMESMSVSLLCCCWPLAPQHTNPSLTSVEDVPAPEAEHLPGAVPLLQGRRELRRGDVQVHRHQGDADQTDMDPPLSHLEPSDGGGLIPASAGDEVTGAHSQQVWQLAVTHDRRRAWS